MFRVGMRVWDILQGWGAVVREDYSAALPLLVHFERSPSPTAYTTDGRRDPCHLSPSLFRQPPTHREAQ